MQSGSPACYAPASAHGAIEEIFEGVFWVRGSIPLGLGCRMDRNMVILREGDDLTLINPVRMDDAGLAQLDGLGHVRHAVRLGAFHGRDDRFYVDRYKADFWCQAGQTRYPEPQATREIADGVPPPVAGSRFFVFTSATQPEAALLIERHRLLLTTDSLRDLSDWGLTNAAGGLLLCAFGLRRKLLIGHPWLKAVTATGGSLERDFRVLLHLEFDHLLGAHGGLVRENAKALVTAVVDETFPAKGHSTVPSQGGAR